MFSAMSYGSISYNAHASLARAADALGIYYNTGEGGLHQDFYQYGANTIVQVASGRFGVHKDYLERRRRHRDQDGAGRKAGHRRPSAGRKNRRRRFPHPYDSRRARTLFPPRRTTIFTPSRTCASWFSRLKEATDYKKPVIVKIAAVHNVAAIATGIARSGADIIAIDGFRGGTGAAPTRIRDNVGIPIELALAAVDQRLRDEGIRNKVSRRCRRFHSLQRRRGQGHRARRGRGLYRHRRRCWRWAAICAAPARPASATGASRPSVPSWSSASNPDDRLSAAWSISSPRGTHEIKEMMGGMGINSIEALRGNRLMLRGVGLNDKELEILGIKHAGRISRKGS